MDAFESRGVRVFIIHSDENHFGGLSAVIKEQLLLCSQNLKNFAKSSESGVSVLFFVCKLFFSISLDVLSFSFNASNIQSLIHGICSTSRGSRFTCAIPPFAKNS